MDEQDQVLVCGCGNSEMSADMYDDGEMRVSVPLINRPRCFRAPAAGMVY